MGDIIPLNNPIAHALEAAEEFDGGGEPESPKPRLFVDRASPDQTVAALRDVLCSAGGLFDRGTAARLYRDPATGTLRVQVLKPENLVLRVHEVCRPYTIKSTRHGESEVDIAFPRPLAEIYLGWHGERGLPPLNGITSSPLLRADGSIHATEGYDAASGLWCEHVPDVEQAIPQNPSRQDAEAALRLLRETFRTFCFADATMLFDESLGVHVVDLDTLPGADESGFLAALLTAICRASLPLAPGLAVRAAPMSGAGAGKGLLVRSIVIIAFGREPHAVSGGNSREELEKRIASELIEAGPILFLDNLNNLTFKSDLLASVITERPARIRILGRSEMAEMNSSAFIALTGNGLTLAEDLVRRFVTVELDPRTEDPEARPFRVDIRALCHERRRELIAAALTIWRWGRLQADLPKGLAAGSFETWSAWVRDPLLALGCRDPMARISETKGRDTERQAIQEVFEIWWARHGDRPMAAKDLAEDVQQALNPLGRSRQYVTARLEKLSGTRIAGLVLVRQASPGKYGSIVYALRKTGAPEQHKGHGGHTGAEGPHAPYAPDAIPGRGEILRGAEVASPVSEFFSDAEQHKGHRGHKVDETPAGDRSDPSGDAPTKTWRMRL